MNQIHQKSGKKIDWFRSIFPIILLCYILFLVGKSAWSNYGINKSISELEKEITELEDYNKETEELNKYYQTESYKERQARLKLGYAKPGESVIIISDSDQGNNAEEKNEESSLTINNQIQGSNWQNWFDYLFKK